MSPKQALIRKRLWFAIGAAPLLAVLLAAAPPAGKTPAQPTAGDAKAPDPFAGLPYRFIGPPGNRASAVVGVPGDANTYYAGAASGGVWKSTDGGIHWKAIFDEQTAQSIGSIAIAPSDSNVVWVGTGESFIRSHVSLGDGIYKSNDAGKTWKRMGLEKTGRIGRIAIDPRNPDVVFAAALGTCYGPQPERGVYRTTDGGRSWERVLFVDENTGASDLAMDPVNPRVLFAGTWQIDIKTWGRKSGGPGSGVFMSKDGGTTWKRLTGHGLPGPPLGKIAVAVAQSDSQRVYALIETGQRGSLWRSDDGGEKWRLVNYSRLLNERPHYYTRMVKLAVEGREETQKLVVRKDPNTGVSDADVQVSAKFSYAIYRDISAPARMINEIEWTRRQLEDFRRMLAAGKADKSLFSQNNEIEKKARAVEDKLLQPTLAEGDLKSFRGPLQLYLKLIWLQAESGVSGSDVSGNADFPPTQPQREVYELLSGQLAESRREFDELYGKTVPAFNDAMRAKGYVQIMNVKEPDEPRPEEPAGEPDEGPDPSAQFPA